MDTESLHFKIGLINTSTKKQSQIKIGIDGKIYFEGYIDPSKDVYYVEFDTDLEEGDHNLEISLLNKLSQDTIVSDNVIVEDMLLEIDSIEIDNIDIGNLKFTLSKYYPEYPKEYQDNEQKKISEVRNCVTLGWNGTWQLPFSSPFYIWLLEMI